MTDVIPDYNCQSRVTTHHISYARYGASDPDIWKDITDHLISVVTSPLFIYLTINNTMLGGDPCPGRPKKLFVELHNGSQREWAEHHTILEDHVFVTYTYKP
jgi:hypothetical protein